MSSPSRSTRRWYSLISRTGKEMTELVTGCTASRPISSERTDSTFSIAFSSSSLKVNISILAMVSALLCHPMHVYLFNHIDKFIYVCLAYLTVSYRSFSFCTSTSVFALSADLTSTLPFSSSEPTFVSFSFSSSFLSSVLSALSCSAF